MRYTSDLTDAQWEIIKDYFPVGNKSKYEKRELVNAVLYLVKTGCQWRNLPKDFPNWKAVSMFYYRVQKKGIWDGDEILKMLVKKTRKANGRNENPTYALIDSQSVKTTSASEKTGYDGEKTKGRKRHIVTDIMGNLLAVHVHAANIHDTKGGVFTFEKALFYYPSVIGICADGAYRKHFKNIFEEFHNLKVDISERLDSTFKVMPKRWRVERTLSWMCHSRRLSKDYEIRTIYAETMVIISHLHTLLRRF